MSPSEMRSELQRLAEEADTARARLGELRARAEAACDLVAAIRAMLKGAESTPAAEGTQEEARLG